jgi:hypothetical protein
VVVVAEVVPAVVAGVVVVEAAVPSVVKGCPCIPLAK